VGVEISRSLGLSAKYRDTEHDSDYSRWAALGTNESYDDIAISLDSPYPVNFLLMCGITTCTFRGGAPLELIDAWLESGSDNLGIPSLDEWLGSVKCAYEQELPDAVKSTLYADTLWERWSSALRLLSSNAQKDPAALLACSMTLLLFGWHNLPNFEIAGEIYRIIDNKLSELWKSACENNRYAFRSPTLFVPDIKYLACNPNGTVNHVARMILAAFPATDLNLSKEVLDQIKELR
jgi:hypothetical protein